MSKYWKHPQYGHVYGEATPTPIGRFCFPSLVSPKDPPPPQAGQAPGQPRFEVTLLLEKDNPKVMEFVKVLTEMTDGMLLDFNKNRSSEIANCKLFGKNGDGDLFDKEKYPYYKNCWVLTARNVQQPQIVDKARDKSDPAEIKGGMKGKLVVTPLITAHGISYKMGAVQLWADDGVRFGGGARDVTDLLDVLDEEENGEATPATPEAPVEPEVVAAAPAKGKNKGVSAAVNLLA